MGERWEASFAEGDVSVEATIVRTTASYQLTWKITRPGLVDRNMVGTPSFDEAVRALALHLSELGIDPDRLTFRTVSD